jgi:DNA repair photolyase
MIAAREIESKTILCKSGISDYSVNCYVGCTHGCAYCYARFMKRFTEHFEPWGQFLDIKVNAPDILAKEVKHRRPGKVFMSSVCDGWQPAEHKHELTRRCLRILLEAGFEVFALTKSTLVRRDFDLLASSRDSSLGCTITTLDECLRCKLEPSASPSEERFRTLEMAAEVGIRTSANFAPLMPELSDTDEGLSALFTRAAEVPLHHINVDKLNPRPGVWNSLVQFLHRNRPELIPLYRRLFFDTQAYEEYTKALGERVRQAAAAAGVLEKTGIGF